VRLAAGRAERALRSLLLLDNRLGVLGDLLAKTVVSGFDGGAEVTVSSGEFVEDPQPRDLLDVASTLTELIGSSRNGQAVGIGLFRRHNRGVITAVTSNEIGAVASKKSGSGVQVSLMQSDSESLVEISWPIP